MATVSNKTANIGTIVNKDLGSASLTVNDALFLVGEAVGTVDNPYGMSNKTANTGTIVNKTSS